MNNQPEPSSYSLDSC